MNFKTNLILVFLTITLTYSCTQEERREIEFAQKNPDSFSTKLALTQKQIEKPDNESHVKVESSNKRKYPNWLMQLYPDSIKTNFAYHVIKQKVSSFKKMNDSISTCIIETEDGVCLNNYLTIIQNQKEINRIEISDACDHDQSFPEYSYSTYKITAANEFIINEYSEYIPEHLLEENGTLKTGKSFMDYETNKDTIIYRLTITNSGEFIKTELPN